MIKDYPKHEESDHAKIILADWLREDGKFAAALEAYQAYAKEKPEGKWAPHAKAMGEAITRLTLNVALPQPQAPGAKAKLTIYARNVPTLKFTAHRVKLEELVKDARVISRARPGVRDLFTLLGRRKGIAKFFQGEPVTWESKLFDKNDYSLTAKELETPLTANGAYVVDVDGGPVRSAVLLLISDLSVIQIVERDRAHAMVVNSATGTPVAEVSALIREVYSETEGGKAKEKVSAATVTTDADGQAEKPLAPKRSYTQDVLTFAWKGDRYAVSGQAAQYGTRDGAAQVKKAYVYTERPVYRPSQVVYYRALLANREQNGDWRPAAGEKVRVRVFDPKDAQIGQEDLTAGEFGSVNGKLELASSPALGPYRVIVTPMGAKDAGALGYGEFRVEEYKKPEFEVTVRGPEGAARVGDKLQARLTARYYFGSPVAGAKVRYTIDREEWIPETPFPRPYEFLYSSAEENSEERTPWTEWRPISSMDHVTGEVTTDAKGEAVIPIDARLDEAFKGRHLKFNVVAEVTDASRRTIEGRGVVRALATQFNAFVQVRQGFYSPGDTLQADIRTLDADGKPVSAEGTVRVLRISSFRPVGIDTAEEFKAKADGVHSEPLKTDAQGRAVFSWKATEAGHYEIRFEARDAWEQLVVGKQRAWVAGDMAGSGVFHNRHVVLVPEQNTYRLGQTAKVLLVSDKPSTTVLLTHEAGDRILEKRVVRMESRSMVLEIPLKRHHSPDVVLAVTGIRDRTYFRSEATLFVPPAEQLLTMEVTPDRSLYKPGEKARFKIRTRDVDGKPVRTETSVGVVDASVFYIAGESTAAIAPFFYSEERGSNLRAQESQTLRFDYVAEDDQPGPKFPEMGWQFPDGLGSLSAGDFGFVNAQWAPAVSLYRGRIEDRDGRMITGAVNIGFRADSVSSGGFNAPVPAAMAGPAGPRGPAAGEAPAGAMGGSGRMKLEAAIAPAVRKNFADTAFWSPAVVTDVNGEATVEVQWPDNLTEWRATARGWSGSAQVGESSADVTTSKDLLVRLQAPRFFVERDEVVLSANVHNYTQSDQRVRVQLQLEGDTLYSAASSPSGPPRPRKLNVPRADRPQPAATTGETGSFTQNDASMEQWVEIPKGSEKRLDWRVRVERPGEAKVRVLADSGSDTDAMELDFPVYVHGVEKLVVKSGSMLMAAGEKPGSRTAKLSVDLPVERATDAGELIVQVTPSVAAAMLDALPYLVDYPYGCVEQTMSRFLPSVVSAKTLTDLGISLADLKKKADVEYARIQAQSPRDREMQSGYSYPEGTPGLRDVRKAALQQWAWRSQKSPVYNPELMKKMVADGLARLRRFQNPDGGWGWWQNDGSDPHMSAYVVQGLIAGKAAGMQPPGEMLTKGLAFLDKAFKKQTDVHQIAYVGWVLSMDPVRAKALAPSLLTAYEKREKLTAYGLSLLALGLNQAGKAAEAKICMENLENTAKIDQATGTCSWGRGSDWWSWENSPVETAAMALRVFNKLSPKHRLAPMVVRWLSNRRNGDAWSSTRDTAMAIQALAEYVKINKELAPDYSVTVDVAGQFKRTFKVTAENALLFDNRLVVPAPALGNGPQSVTVTREGQGNLYYSAYARYFSLEEGIQGTGNEIRVRRRYYRLSKPAGGAKPPKDAPVTEDGYLRALIRPGQRLTSGDLIETELLIESKNDYSYLVFEDMKPAGCEPVDLQSGERYGNGLCSNMELRDEKVAFFITHLPQGKRTLSYRMRAEVPGAFHALPLNGYAMYAPDVRCISDEGNFGIEDAGAAATAAR